MNWPFPLNNRRPRLRKDQVLVVTRRLAAGRDEALAQNDDRPVGRAVPSTRAESPAELADESSRR
jgi:hypothetical protein